jgi:hypothetical protein
MRTKIVEKCLSTITSEQFAEFERDFLEEYAYSRWLEELGKAYGTDTSISLDTVKKAGFKPIMICWFGGEETLIFKTKKEANSAYKKVEVEQGDVYAYWYSKKDFEKEIGDEEIWHKPSKIFSL